METKLKEYNSNYLGQEILSVYNTEIYISVKIRKRLGIKSGNCIQFFLDKTNLAIGIKIISGYIKGTTYVINVSGYCKARISKHIPQGRYLYKNCVDGLFIFKKLK